MRATGLWGLVGVALLGGPARAEISPPDPENAPPPALIPVCVSVFEQQCGLLARDGTWAVEPAYSALYARDDLWETRWEGKAGVLDSDGRLLFEPRFAELGRFSDGLAPASLRGGVRGLSGYVDHRGNWVVPARYFIAGAFSEGLAVVEDWIGGPNDGHADCYYIRPDGEQAFAGKWNGCDAFRFGMAAVDRGPSVRSSSNIDQASMATVDARGNILAPWAKRYRLTPLSADRVLEHGFDHDALLDRHGKVLFRVPEDGVLEYAGEGRFFYALDRGKRGLLDMRSVRPLVTPEHGWDRTTRFSGGVAWVTQSERGGQDRHVLIDLQGRPILKVDYDAVDDFSAGAAAVRRSDGNWRLIDRKGQALTEAVYARFEPAWMWYDQSPRAGDVWRAGRRDRDETVDWIDARGARLATKSKLPCGIEVVRNARDEIIWPRDVEASCFVAASSRGQGWDVPADSGLDDARVMAVRVLRARERVAGLGSLRWRLAGIPDSEPSVEQQIFNAPWQRGPVVVRLEGPVTLDLPPGYRYLAADYVPAVRSLFGELLPPDDGLPFALVVDDDMMVVLRFALVEAGHVSVDDERLDPDSLKLRMRDGVAGFAGARSGYARHSIDWLRQPRWDGDRHRLDWAFRDSNAYAVNSVQLGRQWVLAAQSANGWVFGEDYAVLAQQSLDQVMAGVRFDEDQVYTDARAGDRKAAMDLTGYITGTPARRLRPDAPAAGVTATGRVAAVLAVLVLLAVVVAGWRLSFGSLRRP
ncbi:MAG TPA: DUF2167 domain-containing protein [Luteimonas sp.]|nr:DUF2167 domain-containing protein [Luteimonas sp.]